MLIITNTLIDDIANDLLESGIATVSPGTPGNGGNCATWCELGIPGHCGPCLADAPVVGTRGIRGITVAMHTDGHIQVANGLYQRIHRDADLMPLKVAIADILNRIA